MVSNKTRKLKQRQKGGGLVYSTLNFLKNIPPSKEKDFLKLLLKPRTTIAELELELAKNPDLNAQINGKGFLHELVVNDANNTKIRFLLENGADINIKDQFGYTPLMYASINVATDNLNTLIDFGADLEETNNDGATAMWLAAYLGMVDNTMYLKNAGANGDVCNKDGICAIDVICGHKDCGADFDDGDWLENVYEEIRGNLCRAGARGGVCDEIRAVNARINRIIRRDRNNTGQNIPEMNIGSVHLPKNIIVDEKTGEREPIKNAISWDPIKNGNVMVNFHNEMKAKRFYKKSSFNEYAKNKYNKGLNVTNPYNPSRKINSVLKYTAKIRNRNNKK